MADWATHGRSAGPRRNQEMITTHRPHVALCFRKNMSKGTTDCIRRLKYFQEETPDNELKTIVVIDMKE